MQSILISFSSLSSSQLTATSFLPQIHSTFISSSEKRRPPRENSQTEQNKTQYIKKTQLEEKSHKSRQ